jgi:uncharacterized protein
MSDIEAEHHSSNEWLTGDKPFQILSLDGGGIKGIFSAAALAAIEEDLHTDVTSHFDLITGTSTGGIIALGLGLGMRPRQIVDFYVTHGPNIFKKRWFNGLRSYFSRQYSAAPLETALKRCFANTLFGETDKMFGQSKKRLVIPSYNLGEDDVYNFRTPHHKRLTRDYKVPAWKVALATSSAPTYFPSCRCIDHQRLIDGGVWANNPALVGLVEAVGTLGVPISIIRVFSIGTSDSVTSRSTKLDEGGRLTWVRGQDVIDVITRGQSIGVNNQITFLLGPERVLRLDPKVASGELSLDGVHQSKALIAKAAANSRHAMPAFSEKFQSHIAPEYKPIYVP